MESETLRLVGSSQRSRVLLAERPRGRRVAVKVLRADAVDGAATEADLTAAARSLVGIEGVVPVHEVGRSGDGGVFIVRAYEEGGSLRRLLGQRGPLSDAQTAGVGHQVAQVLAQAHRRGVLHRSVRPENLLLNASGDVWLTDFATTPGDVAHVAPEVLRGEPPSQAADVYALASTLYELAEGRAPFGGVDPGADPESEVRRLTEPAPQPVWIEDETLRTVIMDALAVDPSVRPSASEVAARLATVPTDHLFGAEELPRRVPLGETVTSSLPLRSARVAQIRSRGQKARSDRRSRTLLFAAAIAPTVALGILAVAVLRPDRRELNVSQTAVATSAGPTVEIVITTTGVASATADVTTTASPRDTGTSPTAPDDDVTEPAGLPSPAPGAQPLDAETSELAIRNAMTLIYALAGQPYVESAAVLVDDVTGIADAANRLAISQYASNAQTTTLVLHDLVFTSPTFAWFSYDIVTERATFADRYGNAVRTTDGAWRITRQTVCQDLAITPEAACVPGVTVIRPAG